MKVCDGNCLNEHDVIAYNEYNCPLCDVLEQLDKLQDKFDKLKEEEYENGNKNIQSI